MSSQNSFFYERVGDKQIFERAILLDPRAVVMTKREILREDRQT